MPLFAIHCLDKPGHEAVRLVNRDGHLAHLGRLGERLKLAGPLLDPGGERMIGSLLVIEFADEAAARAFAVDDPYAKAGLFQSSAVHRFRQTFPAA